MSSVEAVCNPEQVARAFGTAGIDLAGSGSVKLERAWPNRKGGVSTSYRGDDGLWSIHGPGDPPRSVRHALRAGQVVRLRELGCWAHRFPIDPSLPHLSAQLAFDHGHERSRAAMPAAAAPRVASYKPLRRCVLHTADDRFVKLMRPQSAVEVVSIYRSVASNPNFGSMGVAIPESVDASAGTLVWRGSPGRPLLEERAAHEIIELMHLVGYGLGRLQRADLSWPRRHRASDELSTLESWVNAAAEAFPAAAPALRKGSADIAVAVPDENAVPLVPAHRDFHDGQLLAGGERVTLLDLDTACVAAPELDVANFLAHLQLRSLQHPDFGCDAAARAFMEGWSESNAGALDAGRLSWYSATALLRLACVYAFRPCWARLSDDLMSGAARQLVSDST